MYTLRVCRKHNSISNTQRITILTDDDFGIYATLRDKNQSSIETGPLVEFAQAVLAGVEFVNTSMKHVSKTRNNSSCLLSVFEFWIKEKITKQRNQYESVYDWYANKSRSQFEFTEIEKHYLQQFTKLSEVHYTAGEYHFINAIQNKLFGEEYADPESVYSAESAQRQITCVGLQNLNALTALVHIPIFSEHLRLVGKKENTYADESFFDLMLNFVLSQSTAHEYYVFLSEVHNTLGKLPAINYSLLKLRAECEKPNLPTEDILGKIEKLKKLTELSAEFKDMRVLFEFEGTIHLGENLGEILRPRRKNQRVI